MAMKGISRLELVLLERRYHRLKVPLRTSN